MSGALLETKLFVPHARDGLVARPRLDQLLGARTRLTLVSAPAGFGKTTLLASWLRRQTGAGTGWVSLDAADREPSSFWSYVLTALDRAAPGTGAAGLPLLDAGQPVETALAAVLNELSVVPVDVVVVLDDLHLAESPAVLPGLALLVERLPPQARLVFSTRADPSLPLARLRARGELTEVRAADLRFTDAEASAFLSGATGLDLPESDVATLGHRTEGWIASLQLAALSLRDRADPSAFIAGFAGDDRHVVDYLVEEVLADEAPEVRDFLLSTAILERLCAPLCAAVTGRADASTLESLERRNLFVVPLDDQRRWFRYHHLFADVLRAHLLHERADGVAELHRRASDWYADAGHPEDAVRHALAAGDADRAAELAELALPSLRRDRREDVLRRWVTELPDDVVRRRPALYAGLTGGLMASNDFAGVARRLDVSEHLLARTEVVVADPAELERLPSTIRVHRAGLALVAGDLDGTIAHARAALDMAADGDDLSTAAAAGLAGLASWAGGDLMTAHDAYTTCAEGLVRAGHIADVLGCSLTLADMELALGRLGDAERTLERALALAGEHGPPPPAVMRGTADMLVALSRAAWHRDDLDRAAELLREADRLGEPAGLPQHPYRWRVALARLRVAAGDHGGALELLDEAERVYVGDFSPAVHPVHATRARVLVAAGDLAGATAWAERRGVRADDELSYLREYEHLTLARVLLATRQVRAATGLLDRLLAAARDGGRLGTVLEVQALRGLALSAGGDEEGAVAALADAVDLAEPDGWVRVIADAGAGLSPVLDRLATQRPASAFLQRLRGGDSGLRPVESLLDPMLDPLSDRELDVLRLLGSDLDGPGIARELVVSLNTVRTHTKHIYTKLGVNNRRAAVSRAHQLGLLSRPGRH